MYKFYDRGEFKIIFATGFNKHVQYTRTELNRQKAQTFNSLEVRSREKKYNTNLPCSECASCKSTSGKLGWLKKDGSYQID